MSEKRKTPKVTLMIKMNMQVIRGGFSFQRVLSPHGHTLKMPRRQTAHQRRPSVVVIANQGTCNQRVAF